MPLHRHVGAGLCWYEPMIRLCIGSLPLARIAVPCRYIMATVLEHFYSLQP